jgi:N-acetylmuramoyl-L-alanine amidase
MSVGRMVGAGRKKAPRRHERGECKGKAALCLAAFFVLALPCALAREAAVTLDVGHTLARPGATSARGVGEFFFNRAFAAAVESALAERGIAAVETGSDGLAADLYARARNARGRLFLSLHHDAVQPRYQSQWRHDGVSRAYSDRFSGFSLFVSRRNPRAEASLRCASRIGQALRAAGFAPSRYHAEAIPGENRPFADEVNGVHYFDDLVVLRAAAMPAVLLEAGVIVNRDEELRLAAPEERRRMARAVAAGVAGCLGEAISPAG